MSTINEHLRRMKEVQDLLLQDPAVTTIETYSDDYESEEDDNTYNYNDEKAYICDYDTIYICLYEELEEYRISKQAKKENTTNSWNNLLVVLPDGANTNLQNASSRISEEATKLTTNENKPDTKIEGCKGLKFEPNVQESAEQETNNSNNITHSHLPEMKTAKVSPVQSNKQKLSKKQLKKQRQKEKRKQKESKEKDQEEEAEEENNDDIAADDEEPEDIISKDKLRSESKAESLESAQDEVDDQESEDNDQVSVDTDLPDEMAFSAFVSNALKKKKILIKKEEKTVKTSDLTKANKKAVVSVEQKPVEKKTALPSKPKTTPVTSSASAQPNVDSDFDFTIKKIKRSKTTVNEYQEAVALGKEAYKQIMNNDIPLAVQSLTKAINCNSYDLRHFLNRSFCYLRLGAYNLALKDAEVVIKFTNEREETIKAKFRFGQALCGLQNFEEAEKQLSEAYKLSQINLHIYRELMRVRTLQLLHMGFRERDILDAFKERSSITDVISILTEKTSVDKDEDYIYGNECEVDDIYNSDDEENPSCTRMLSNMLKYQPGISKKVPIVPSSPSKFVNSIQTATGLYRNPVVTEAKKIINTVLPKPVVANKGLVNDKAIWVGNTTPEITDNMLRKKFTRYGKIISIYRKPNESYTFINFETAKAVTELLSSIAKTQSVEIEGHKLPVKAATRAK